MFVHICMLTDVYELLITQLHIFSINFINVLSYYRFIRYLVFLALFPSISMVFMTLRELRVRLAPVNRFKPSSKIFY